MTGQDSVMRSRIVKEVNKCIADAYGLIYPARTAEEVTKNQTRVNTLLANSSFHFEVRPNSLMVHVSQMPALMFYNATELQHRHWSVPAPVHWQDHLEGVFPRLHLLRELASRIFQPNFERAHCAGSHSCKSSFATHSPRNDLLNLL